MTKEPDRVYLPGGLRSAPPPATAAPRPLAVLVVAYKNPDLLRTCLAAVAAHLPDCEVLVWDNSGPGYPGMAQVVAEHPAVAEVAVFGVPDDEMGERVVAFVEPADDAEGLAEELTAYARERIAHFKVPREFIVTDDLPRTPTGKLVKGRLKDRYAEERG